MAIATSSFMLAKKVEQAKSPLGLTSQARKFTNSSNYAIACIKHIDGRLKAAITALAVYLLVLTPGMYQSAHAESVCIQEEDLGRIITRCMSKNEYENATKKERQEKARENALYLKRFMAEKKAKTIFYKKNLKAFGFSFDCKQLAARAITNSKTLEYERQRILKIAPELEEERCMTMISSGSGYVPGENYQEHRWDPYTNECYYLTDKTGSRYILNNKNNPNGQECNQHLLAPYVQSFIQKKN